MLRIVVIIVALVLPYVTAASAQQLRVGKSQRTCTAKEVSARVDELPAAIPIDARAAANIISAALGCDARVLLTKTYPPPFTDGRLDTTQYYRSSSLWDDIMENRRELAFRSLPDGAEIWVEGVKIGLTNKGTVIEDNSLQEAVLKKSGYQDCVDGQWVLSTPKGQGRTVFCQLTPLASEQSGGGLAFYQSIDLYGSDLVRMRTESVDQCLSACLDNSLCVAVTVNTDPQITKGPNCFLKSDRGNVEFYEEAISVIILPPGDDGALTFGSERVQPFEVRPRP